MKIDVLIPAYNESQTIFGVITVAKASPWVNEVIVISDGSSDQTAEIARAAGAKVIELRENKGKDIALDAGVKDSTADYFLFLDADLIGLKPHHIDALLEPVISQRADTTMGVFRQGNFQTDLAQRITPFLSGQRVISRQMWYEALSSSLGVGFGLETILHRYIRSHQLRLQQVELKGVSQWMKEQKLGFFKGFCYRLRMYSQIICAVLGLTRPKRRRG